MGVFSTVMDAVNNLKRRLIYAKHGATFHEIVIIKIVFFSGTGDFGTWFNVKLIYSILSPNACKIDTCDRISVLRT